MHAGVRGRSAGRRADAEDGSHRGPGRVAAYDDARAVDARVDHACDDKSLDDESLDDEPLDDESFDDDSGDDARTVDEDR